MEIKGRWLFLVLILLQTTASAQLPLLEQVPSAVKWYRIKTTNFDVIYQSQFRDEAHRTANLLERTYTPLTKSLNYRPRKIPVVLQAQNVISNGFVSLQPWRSEFFPTPTQDNSLMGNNNWLDMLSVHEFRHVVQLDKVNTGFNRALYYLFGNQIIEGIETIALPDWYLEGDATTMETVYTSGGRGRIPKFDLEFRANLIEKGGFTYNKQHLGSFKDFVPDEYRLGYYMVNYLRKYHGAEVWEKIHRRAKAWPIVPFMFSNAMKRYTGSYLVSNYEGMKQELTKRWSAQQPDHPDQPRMQLEQEPPVFTNYQYPQTLDGGEVVCLKSGLGDFSQFVTIDEQGVEELLHIPGIPNSSPMLSAENGKLAWSAYEFDARWAARTYSVIKILDIETGEVLSLTRKSRYSSAALDPSAEKVVTVETDASGKHQLVILDARSGAVLNTFYSDDNDFYAMPRFTTDGLKVITIRLEGERRGISEWDPESGLMRDYIAPRLENLGHPVDAGDYILYNSPAGGIDNIFALEKASQQVFQVTNATYGAYNPELRGRQLYYNLFTVEGMRVVSMEVDPQQWKPSVRVEPPAYFADVLAQEDTTRLSVQDTVLLQEGRYRRWANLINIYNWGPLVDATNFDVEVGVFSTDVLGMSSLGGGYHFDLDEGSGFWVGRFSYQGLYPVLDFEYTNGDRRDTRLVLDSADSVVERKYRWKEQTVKTGFRIPLSNIRSKYFENFEFGSAFGWTRVREFNFPDERLIDQLGNGDLLFLEHNLSYSRVFKTSKRDLFPKFGQVAEALLQYGLPGDFEDALYFSLQTRWFFPGFLKHHSFNFVAGYQHQLINLEQDNYSFRDNVGMPRGYGTTSFENMVNLSLNYAFPFLYPDLGLGPVLYIQRLNANLFYDYSYGIAPGLDRNFQSLGIELTANFNVMRFTPLFEVGIRYLYRLPENDSGIELVIGAIRF